MNLNYPFKKFPQATMIINYTEQGPTTSIPPNENIYIHHVK